ncbi:outer membrane lipoprotein, Slp family [Dickeya chrysanthemi Ech1591]|uniref:Outer membrane lipoprotein, Slp family n=1 Tax=Dickeya chrysanthemi (strain Ech1591) TaxID=561229 RepID=C6CHE0_DICC1|nr:Slp family lipoprotein [Dickeya chrysanthemi]ACT06841.1 outer membrane lipoprotein, Slp family [Dickeya chrysanthemi Ech1591]WJM87207.1 Slp family lipoprotein [Dickeya chrysanthemi]
MTIQSFGNQTSKQQTPWRRRGGWYGLLLIGLSLLSGCVTVPDEIRGTSATPQMDLIRVMNAPNLYTGQESRFGGRIADIRNEADRTRLEIVALPLDGAGRPRLDEPSEGRLVAYVNRFLEPLEFKNQLITVVGPISGSEKGKIGERPYTFVVVNVQGYKRWRVVQQVVLPPRAYDPWWDRRYRHAWGPGWGPGWNDGYAPVQVESVVTE